LVAKITPKTNPVGAKGHRGLPDLDPIIDAFVDAQALVLVACRALEGASVDDRGPAELVLGRGVTALEKVLDRLEEAGRQMNQFQSAEGVL